MGAGSLIVGGNFTSTGLARDREVGEGVSNLALMAIFDGFFFFFLFFSFLFFLTFFSFLLILEKNEG